MRSAAVPALEVVDASLPTVAPRSCDRRCPVCDADRPEPLFDNRMAPIAGIDFGYHVVACGRCGMVYASRSPDPATTERYYRDLSKYDHPRSIEDVARGDRHRAEVAAAFTRRLLPPGARVLDVGCAIGIYVAAMSRDGSFVAHGLDPSNAAADVARRLFEASVQVGSAYDFDRYEHYDAIALLAVLEHLREPRRLLETLARRMKPGATLIVEVPNADVFGDYPAIGRASEPLGEFSNEHINFFGEAALRRLAAQTGLSWIASEPLPYLAGFDGLLAAFRKADRPTPALPPERTRASVRRYVAASTAALDDVASELARAGLLERPSVLYGAGSHSARMLAQGPLADAPIRVALDRNPHLTGRTIGTLRIEPPDALAGWPDLPVVVSSFHAMPAIADDLRSRFDNELVLLYPVALRPVDDAHPPRAREQASGHP